MKRPKVWIGTLVLLTMIDACFGLPVCRRDDSGVRSTTGPAFPRKPLVVNGRRSKMASPGATFATLTGGPELMHGSDPILSIAHLSIVPDPGINLEPTGLVGGNTPDKFVHNETSKYLANGQPLTIDIRLDGRKHELRVAGRIFDLARGNFFRIRVVRGPGLITEQLPALDTIESDMSKVEARFAAFP